MRRMRRALAAVAAAAVVVVTGGPVAVPAGAGAAGTAVRPPEVTVVELRPLAPGDTTAVTGLDGGGRAIGRSGGQAVRWDEAGTPTPLAPRLPEGGTSEAIAVAAGGAVAGSEVVPSSTPGGPLDVAAVLWRDGERVRLSGPAPVADRPIDINGREQVLLRVGTGGSPPDTAVWDDGVTTTAPHVDGGFPIAGADLNERGLVVGTSNPGSPLSRAWAWRPGRAPVELPPPGGLDSVRAVAVNDRGDVVGEGQDADGHTRMVLWRDGRAVDLGTLGGPSAFKYVSDRYPPRIVNDRGDVVGTSVTASGTPHAFRWRDGAMADLGDLGGGEATVATAVNRRGDVLAVAFGAAGESTFLWRDGRTIDLQALVGGPAWIAGARSLNDRGQVAGTTLDRALETRSYLWTVP